jgi:hypothetical protein
MACFLAIRQCVTVILLAVTSSVSASEAPLTCSFLTNGECGCILEVRRLECPPGGAHFVHELVDGAPLIFILDGRSIHANSRYLRSNSFTPAQGDTWSEIYDHPNGDGVIRVNYRPGVSTCQKPDPELEPCEYFDVEAEVVIEPVSSSPRTFSTVGMCGC